MMERQVHHLVRLVDDLLDVSRVMRGKIELRREPVELATVVARAVETVQPLIEVQGHQLDVSLPPDSLLLDADPVRLAQVVGNLLTNAAKYTEPDGRIWLTAEREGDRRSCRCGTPASASPRTCCRTSSSCSSRRTTPRPRSQGGLGIGLTLVKNLVEMHGGTVEATSDGLGKGSEFVVRLPLLVQPQVVPGSRRNRRQQEQATAVFGPPAAGRGRQPGRRRQPRHAAAAARPRGPGRPRRPGGVGNDEDVFDRT